MSNKHMYEVWFEKAVILSTKVEAETPQLAYEIFKRRCEAGGSGLEIDPLPGNSIEDIVENKCVRVHLDDQSWTFGGNDGEKIRVWADVEIVDDENDISANVDTMPFLAFCSDNPDDIGSFLLGISRIGTTDQRSQVPKLVDLLKGLMSDKKAVARYRTFGYV